MVARIHGAKDYYVLIQCYLVRGCAEPLQMRHRALIGPMKQVIVPYVLRSGAVNVSEGLQVFTMVCSNGV